MEDLHEVLELFSRELRERNEALAAVRIAKEEGDRR